MTSRPNSRNDFVVIFGVITPLNDSKGFKIKKLFKIAILTVQKDNKKKQFK